MVPAIAAIARAEGREAEILPIAVGVVVETDARIPRRPRSKSSKSSSRRSTIRSLQNLHAVFIESDYSRIRASYGGFHDITFFDVGRARPRLEVPIAAIRAIPAGDVTIRIVGHHAAIGFISRDALGRNGRPQPQFNFMAAPACRRLIDFDRSRDRLCRLPLARKNGRWIAKVRRLTDAISQAGGGLHVTPETPSSPDSSSPPETRERRSGAVSSHPVSALADGVFCEWKGGAVGVAHICRTRIAIPASSERNRDTDEEDGLQAMGRALLCSHSAKLTH
jgi:hypothetical protein